MTGLPTRCRRCRIYRDGMLQDVYDTLMALWLRRSPYLWLENDEQRSGSSDQSAFWRGYKGDPDRVVRGSAKSAARAAGIDCAREQRRRDKEVRSARP